MKSGTERSATGKSGTERSATEKNATEKDAARCWLSSQRVWIRPQFPWFAYRKP